MPANVIPGSYKGYIASPSRTTLNTSGTIDAGATQVAGEGGETAALRTSGCG